MSLECAPQKQSAHDQIEEERHKIKIHLIWKGSGADLSGERPTLAPNKKSREDVGGSVQANIEYLYIRSYGQTASVTSNLRVYSQT